MNQTYLYRQRFGALAGFHDLLDEVSRPQVVVNDVVKRRIEDELVLVRLHGEIDDLVDVEETHLLIQEHGDRLFVRRGENTGHRTSEATGGVAHGERRV